MTSTRQHRTSSARPRRRAVGLLLLTAVLSAHAWADEGPEDQSEREREIELIRDYAAQHQIAPASPPNSPCELQPDPLIYWTNPIRGDVFGGIFLWTQDSRPMAFGGLNVWRMDSGNELGREFHSLTETPLNAEYGDSRFWVSTRPGVRFRVVPDVQPPAGSPVVRLRQMKRIATKFSMSIPERTEKLRLLPRPLYRYADSDSGLMDGALFAFVQATDPEALLLVEARSTEDAHRWHYAIVRCTAWAVTARLGGSVVYDVPRYDFTRNDPSSAFVVLKRLPVE